METKITILCLLAIAAIASGQAQQKTHLRAERHTDGGVMTSGTKEFHSTLTRHERDATGVEEKPKPKRDTAGQ
ncbi:hypothetical protein FO519_009847, partial [Halicephalobus sp. NKZ332]